MGNRCCRMHATLLLHATLLVQRNAMTTAAALGLEFSH